MECGNKILVMDKAKLQNNGTIWYNKWLLEHKGLICSNPSLPSTGNLKVDLSPIDTKMNQFAWLKKFSNYISYSESYETIYSSHIVDETWSEIDNLIEDEINQQKVFIKTISDFHQLGIDFETYNFEKVISFEILNKRLIISYLDDYDSSKTCYSVPFFKSIMVVNNFVDLSKLKFHFVEIDFRYRKAIAFKITYDEAKISYYDYSDEPSVVAALSYNENIEA